MLDREAGAGFDLGESLAIGLDTNQIAHLAGALFLGIFSLSALRRAKQAEGVLPVVWLVVAVGLFAGTFLVAVRGFPDYIPDRLHAWTDPDRLARACAVLCLLCGSAVLLSAHWVRGSLARWGHRVGGLAVGGVAVWLAAGWFATEIPEEVRPWTARAVLVRVIVVLGLMCLAAAFWARETWGTPAARWANRALTPAAAAIAVILAWRWFGPVLGPEYLDLPVERVATVLGAIASGTCLLIATGSLLIRDRPANTSTSPRPTETPPRGRPTEPPARKAVLPVAVLLDEQGRPVLPPGSPRSGQSGPVGA